MAVLEEGGASTFTFVSTPLYILLHSVYCRSCALQFQVICGTEICFYGSLFLLRQGSILSSGGTALALHMVNVGLIAKGTMCLFHYCGQSTGPPPSVLRHPHFACQGTWSQASHRCSQFCCSISATFSWCLLS